MALCLQLDLVPALCRRTSGDRFRLDASGQALLRRQDPRRDSADPRVLTPYGARFEKRFGTRAAILVLLRHILETTRAAIALRRSTEPDSGWGFVGANTICACLPFFQT